MLDVYYSVTVGIAIAILCILAKDIFGKKNKEWQGHKEFKSFVYSTGLFLIVDVTWGFAHKFMGNTFLFIDSTIYNITMILTVWMCCRYVSTYLQLRNKKGKFLNIFGEGLFYIDLTMVVINFFTPILFWIDVEGNYHAGIIRNIGMYVLGAVFISICILAFYDARIAKDGLKDRFSAIFYVGFFITISLAVQAFIPIFPAYSIGLIIGILTIYVQIHVAEQSNKLEQIRQLNTNLEEKQHEVEENTKELRKLDKMLDATNIGVWELINIEGQRTKLRTNRNMKIIMGLPADSDITDEDACDVINFGINHDDLAMFADYDTRLKSGQRAECTYRWMHPTRGERYIRCGGALISKTEKEVVCCGYHYDVTDEVKTEKELELNIAANKAKTRFLQNMSHEIRTPLNAMFGFAQLLGLPDGSWTDEEKEKYNRIIFTNFYLLDMLINDILDSADIQNGNYRMKIGEFNVNEIGQNALLCVEFRHTDSVQMKFSTDVDDDYKITSDAKRTQQILINFLTNACKNTQKGEIHLHISNKERPGMISFSVTDTGTGVPAEKAEMIFHRFTKLDQDIDGSGLGLNICHTISTKLGGKVYLDTTYTGGARFVLELPANKQN